MLVDVDAEQSAESLRRRISREMELGRRNEELAAETPVARVRAYCLKCAAGHYRTALSLSGLCPASLT